MFWPFADSPIPDIRYRPARVVGYMSAEVVQHSDTIIQKRVAKGDVALSAEDYGRLDRLAMLAKVRHGGLLWQHALAKRVPGHTRRLLSTIRKCKNAQPLEMLACRRTLVYTFLTIHGL